MSHYKEIERCRVCGSKALREVLWLEPQHLSPTFVKSNKDNPKAEIKVPLTLVLCDKNEGCGLLQLKQTVNPDLLYKDYFYRTATNKMMCDELNNVVEDVMKCVSLSEGDYVVDVGANDCTMLTYYPSYLNRVGVEPAKNIDWSNLDKSIKVVNDYFSKETVEKITGGKKVKIITGCAVFYDMDDPNAVVKDIKEILAPDGIICLQLSYLADMIRNMNFYDICNEHLEYYSLATLQALFDKHDMYIFDATTNWVNGGSIRVFITHNDNFRGVSANLRKLYEEENKLNLFDPKTYEHFYKDMEHLGQKVKGFMKAVRGKVLGLGASTKGNVLLQFFGIDKDMMPYISEKNPEKVGLRTLGTDIELISEERAREMNPGCMLVLPWYFKKEIIEREQGYLNEGGILLFPMPYAHIVNKNGEVRL